MGRERREIPIIVQQMVRLGDALCRALMFVRVRGTDVYRSGLRYTRLERLSKFKFAPPKKI